MVWVFARKPALFSLILFLTGTMHGLDETGVPDAPSVPVATAYSSRSVNLSWTQSRSDSYPPVEYYVVFVKIGTEGYWDLRKGTQTPNNNTEFRVSNLTPHTRYTFRIVAVNANGESRPGEPSSPVVTLMEVPVGKPLVTDAYGIGSSSVRLHWVPPSRSTIRGEFLGYRITYTFHNKSEEKRVVVVGDPTTRDFTINNLATFTRYIISIRVFNPKGEGPSTSVIVKTGEGVSSAPSNLTAYNITDHSIALRWNRPKKPNGIVRGYKVYCIHFASNLQKINRITVRHPENYEQVLNNLNPFTQYRIWIRAYNERMEGDSSETLEITTDVKGPSAPEITNLACASYDELLLKWKRPQIVYRRVDYYMIYYRSDITEDFRQLILKPSYDKNDHSMIIPNLTTKALYEVKVRAATFSIVERTKLYKGQFSVSWKVIVQSHCRGIVGSPNTDKPGSARKMADDVCLACIVFLSIVSLRIWRY